MPLPGPSLLLEFLLSFFWPGVPLPGPSLLLEFLLSFFSPPFPDPTSNNVFNCFTCLRRPHIPAIGAEGKGSRFSYTQFIVLLNRALSCGVAIFVLRMQRSTILASSGISSVPSLVPNMPLYKFTMCSISNIMSSWCQYEALKYVPFPVAVLFKSSKILPTMLMGKVGFILAVWFICAFQRVC